MSLPAHLAYYAKEALLRRDTLRLLAELAAHDSLSRQEIDQRAWQRLAEVTRFAMAHVPHYQRMWSGHDIDEALSSPEAFAALPISRRADLAESNLGIVAQGTRGRLAHLATSGSSGDRLYFWSDFSRGGWAAAALLRARRQLGIEPGDRAVRFYSIPFRQGQTATQWLRHLANDVSNRMIGLSRMSAYDMGADHLLAHARTLQRIDPEMISGYAGSLARLALFMQRRGLRLAPGRLKATTYMSEPANAIERQAMLEVFGAPVASEYICRESGLIAHECLHGNLHITDDLLYVETIDAQGRPVVGEPGEIVLSDLRPSRTPYLRYWLGDVATLAPDDYVCPCGCTRRVLTELQGRVHEHIHLRDGGVLPSFFIASIIKTMPNVSHWQTVLKGQSMHVRFECSPEQLAPMHDRIVAWIEDRVNHEYDVSIEAVAHIAPMPSGKYALVIREDGA